MLGKLVLGFFRVWIIYLKGEGMKIGKEGLVILVKLLYIFCLFIIWKYIFFFWDLSFMLRV